MFCSNCGTQLPNDANFCLKCGQRLRAVASPKLSMKFVRFALTE
ncbi:MAG: zinc-ribbon domain-containing protein [Caldilineaceae bacterium]